MPCRAKTRAVRAMLNLEFLKHDKFFFALISPISHFKSRQNVLYKTFSFGRDKKNSNVIRKFCAACTKLNKSAEFFVGAGNGNRTHLSSLGSSHSTDELYPRVV